VDYGPIPFKTFHSWSNIEGFEQLVKDSWHNDVVVDLNEMSYLKKKFQMLKKKIKIWDLRDLDAFREKDLVQKAKVKWAIEVWDCGRDKSPGPNGFTFEFIRKFWEVIGGDVYRVVKCFFRSGSFPKGCNPSFIALIPKVNDAKFVKDFRLISIIGCQYKIVGKILTNRLSSVIGSLVSKEQSAFIRGRQVLDGPMMLSEVIDWCNQKKRKAMIFKVDFEKAYDSVRWDFLDMILYRFGFGDTWRGWIKGCLVSSTDSILVNGSLTQEFYFPQGLRQGDPLSPFLFMLVMESLHISFVHAMEGAFFKGIKVSSHESLHISHLFYADDAVFIGEWKEDNLRHLISVKHDEVIRGAHLIECEAAKTPFKYLGVMVGSKMSHIHSWDLIIDKVVARLSNERRRRFLLVVDLLLPKRSFFRGMEPGVRKASWFSWDSVVASKEVGGLGMSNFFAMNRALLFKWIWRFKAHPEAMWVLVIKAIHGPCGNLDQDNPLGKTGWGKNAKRGAEGMQMEELTNTISTLKLVEDQDSWSWNLDGEGVFSVSSARRFIDEGLCVMDGSPTRWLKLIPIKVNILAWCLASNKLPTRFNMSLRGLEVPSIECLVSRVVGDSVYRYFFVSRLVKLVRWFEVKEGGERLLGKYDVRFVVDHLELSK
ncbi:RNA-directed DNA polymerase, eukaryota, partial [Tanacetum coccineum]